ncbi:MAG: methyltransferase domain-containing protein [Thermoplasmata archaeon]
MVETVRIRVRKHYADVAKSESCCLPACCNSDYSAAELERIPPQSVLGEGSGNPVRHANPQNGEVVVDLGSGAGIDVFLAANQVGPRGRVIGVDMTPEMVERARRSADKSGATNVEFHTAVIEELPLAAGVADVVLSNCVINLSPDKAAVFREAFRILKAGGRLVISDIVQERPLGRMEDDCGCVANAMIRADYLDTIRRAGFRNLRILEDRPAIGSSTDVDASAITLRAWKPEEEARP